MSAQHFVVQEHISPCQHIREFPHGVKNDAAVLHLAVKEYRPRNNLEPEEGSVTIIASHANGFTKECYEPLWDDLVKLVNGFKIRAIWMADNAHQGASYARNAAELGDDPNWLDHSRDLLLMVNTFRDRMVQPIVGLGHSMGCAQIGHLSILHPRLFHSLVLIEPVIQDVAPPGPNSAMFSSMRREQWSSREKAEASISTNPFFASMDPRVLKNYLRSSLRDTEDGGVTLTTPKAQEAWSYVRPIFAPLPGNQDTPEARNRERLLSPDIVPFSESSTTVFVRPECIVVKSELPHLRPRTLYVYGDFSPINFDDIREERLKITGTGRGGSGGHADGCVEEVVIEDGAHLVCFEKPDVVAVKISEWLEKELSRWKREIEFWATTETGKSKDGRTKLSEEWLKGVKEDADWQRRKVSAKL